jgi:predicted phage-related endonuclease
MTTIRSPEWHAERRKGIGGSDCNIIMGGDDEALLRLWRVKRGEAEPENLDDVLPVRMGIATEDLNITWATKTLGPISRVNRRVSYSAWPLLTMELDGLTENGVPVEAKHVNAFAKIEDVIAKYQPQLHASMLCAGCESAWLSVFIGTLTHELCPIDFDPFYADMMMDRLKSFWAHVQDGTPPVSLPTISAPVVPVREVDMTGNNSFAAAAADWIAHKAGADKFATAVKDIKAMCEADAKVTFGHGIKASRNKAGSITIKEVV